MVLRVSSSTAGAKVYHAEGPPQLRVRTAGAKCIMLKARSRLRVTTADLSPGTRNLVIYRFPHKLYSHC